MKAVLTYWVIGCIFIGLTAGMMINDCPRDRLAPMDIAVAVLVWPSMLSAVLTYRPTGKLECSSRAPSSSQ